ncbi:MAG: DUF3307 domain-containing protein [Chloroflexota bacterium]|nr:DUF3307 domain-containing protein [Chloroflexota bacterium]
MTIFTWLLVAHLVGDWMLQNDWMARCKQQTLINRAIAMHCLLYTIAILLSLWLATQHESVTPPFVRFALIIFGSHWLIDAANLADYWRRLFRQSDQRFVAVMVDQTLHVIVLACLVEFLL